MLVFLLILMDHLLKAYSRKIKFNIILQNHQLMLLKNNLKMEVQFISLHNQHQLLIIKFIKKKALNQRKELLLKCLYSQLNKEIRSLKASKVTVKTSTKYCLEEVIPVLTGKVIQLTIVKQNKRE